MPLHILEYYSIFSNELTSFVLIGTSVLNRSQNSCGKADNELCVRDSDQVCNSFYAKYLQGSSLLALADECPLYVSRLQNHK